MSASLIMELLFLRSLKAFLSGYVVFLRRWCVLLVVVRCHLKESWQVFVGWFGWYEIEFISYLGIFLFLLMMSIFSEAWLKKIICIFSFDSVVETWLLHLGMTSFLQRSFHYVWMLRSICCVIMFPPTIITVVTLCFSASSWWNPIGCCVLCFLESGSSFWSVGVVWVELVAISLWCKCCLTWPCFC